MAAAGMSPRMPTPQSDRARFEAKIERDEGCWLWRGSVHRISGYGAFWLDRRQRLAHRVAHEFFTGPIPDGYQVDHLCNTRLCVNPEHLKAVTPQDNTLRTDNPAAINARKTHCPRGHLLDGRSGKQRTCKTCLRAAARIRRATARTA